jgi:hypothetical protein
MERIARREQATAKPLRSEVARPTKNTHLTENQQDAYCISINFG